MTQSTTKPLVLVQKERKKTTKHFCRNPASLNSLYRLKTEDGRGEGRLMGYVSRRGFEQKEA